MAHYLLIVILTAIACWSIYTLASVCFYHPRKGQGRSTVSRIAVGLLSAGTLVIAYFPLHTRPWALVAVAASAFAGILSAVGIRALENAAEESKAAVTAQQRQDVKTATTGVVIVTLIPVVILALVAAAGTILSPL